MIKTVLFGIPDVRRSVGRATVSEKIGRMPSKLICLELESSQENGSTSTWEMEDDRGCG